MSSIIDANINQNCITNKRVITIDLDLSLGNDRTIDLTKGMFGFLDFQPDEVHPKYYTYVSRNNHTYDEMAVITCDFIRGSGIICPFYALTSHESFYSLSHLCTTDMDIRHSKFSIKNIDQEQIVDNTIYTDGNILIALEFIRYARYKE